MTSYVGDRTIDGVVVTADGQLLDSYADLKAFSLSSFEWSYEGPEPKQLAFRERRAGLRERLEQHHPGGRVEGEGEALGGLLRLGATGCGGVGEVAAQAFDVWRELHDVTMTPK